MRKLLLSLLFAVAGAPACVMAQHGLVVFANYADLGLRGTTGGAGVKIVHVTDRTDYIDIAPSSGSSGIESIEGPAQQQVRIYSLDGRYLGSDIGRLGKGIYIINNRKVVISGR